MRSTHSCQLAKKIKSPALSTEVPDSARVRSTVRADDAPSGHGRNYRPTQQQHDQQRRELVLAPHCPQHEQWEKDEPDRQPEFDTAPELVYASSLRFGVRGVFI